MDPCSQGALGAAAATTVAGAQRLRAFAVLGCIAGMVPDLDILIGSSTDPLLFLEYHRQFTQALVFIPVGAGFFALALHWPVRHVLRPVETYLACAAGYATHGLLDACTSYGTQLMWPFSDVRVAWNNVSVVDPLFTLPLIAFVIVAVVKRRRGFAAIGLAWAAGYLLLGVVQTQRVEAAGAAMAAVRGHEAERLTVKAGFGNLLVWKVIYESGGRYYVDAVRAGLEIAVCPGASVPALALRRDLPWLDANSVQARDVERFRWFSDDYLALDPANPARVIDMRYSVVPNEIEPLWGIELDPKADPDQHAGFVATRRTSPDQRDAYWGLLTGADCPGTIKVRSPEKEGRFE
ncbi:MAG: metal-dependent hydrolase [Gammaproteobacteria bacterium]|nr:metal-dependent hydrolase [Gammaproteobacteria bacterium]